jgi:hypothetical protein
MIPRKPHPLIPNKMIPNKKNYGEKGKITKKRAEKHVGEEERRGSGCDFFYLFI